MIEDVREIVDYLRRIVEDSCARSVQVGETGCYRTSAKSLATSSVPRSTSDIAMRTDLAISFLA